MDYVIYNENGETVVIESSEEEELTKNGESRLVKYRVLRKEAAKK